MIAELLCRLFEHNWEHQEDAIPEDRDSYKCSRCKEWTMVPPSVGQPEVLEHQRHDMDEAETFKLAPDCQRDECEEPARYQYEVRKTCSGGPYSVSRERCEQHQMETRRTARFEYVKINKVFGKGSKLKMDPHYYCKENGGEWCADGYKDSCPVHT